MILKGIDVSYHQGVIDWKRVKSSGIRFAMLRAGYGKNNIDKQFNVNATSCQELGIPFGVYWFSYAYTIAMARRETQYCVQALRPYKVTYPVSFDLEYDTVSYAKKHGVTITRKLATDMAMAFCEEVERLGYKGMNYANRDYMLTMFNDIPYDLWFARYSAAPGRKDMAIWQYSSSGAVPGIAGKVDMNYCYKDYTESNTEIQRRIIQKGDTGRQVGQIQGVLRSQGWTDGDGKGLETDNIFGECTRQALIKAQEYYEIEADGIWGPECDSVIMQGWLYRLQCVIGADKDGIPGPDTLSHTPTISRYINPRHRAVRLVQERLNCLGYPTGNVDGIAGVKFDTGVKQYQREIVGLKLPDGELTGGKNTWISLLEQETK
jgi:lysozyme